MGDISSVVSVTISTDTMSLSRAGFGTMMLFGPHTMETAYTGEYTGMTGVSAVFPSDTDIYRAANAVFLQSPAPSSIKIGRLLCDDLEVTIDTYTAGHVYAAKVGSSVYTHTEGTVDYAITAVGVAPANTFDIAGDHTAEFLAGDKFRVSGSTNNDGWFTVVGSAFGATTTITVTEDVGAVADGDLTQPVAEALKDAIMVGAAATVTATHVTGGQIDVANAVSGTAYVFQVGTGAGAAFAISHSKMSVDWTIATGAWGAGLTALVNDDPDWYGLITISRTQADQEATALWAQANSRLACYASATAAIKDTTLAADLTSLPAVFKTAGYTRNPCLYHSLADGTSTDQWIDAAWMGEMFTYDLDSTTATWKFKTLIGITADVLTPTQRTNITAKYCNLYESIGGVSITREGKVPSGEWIDTIQGIDWMQARMQEKVYAALVNSRKIPYTNAGIAVIENAVIAIMNLALNTEFIAFDSALDQNVGYIVSVPLVSSVSAADKAARELNDVTFQGTLAGAIHVVTITGNISV